MESTRFWGEVSTKEGLSHEKEAEGSGGGDLDFRLLVHRFIRLTFFSFSFGSFSFLSPFSPALGVPLTEAGEEPTLGGLPLSVCPWACPGAGEQLLAGELLEAAHGVFLVAATLG